MKRIPYSVLLAGLTALALAACTSNGMRDDTARTSMTDGEYGSTPDVSSSTSGTAGTAATGDQASESGAMASTPNSTVTNIEVVPRQSGTDSGAGTVAGAAVGGTTGSTTSDRVYRITLQMDDGTAQIITQESTPTFRVGERVRLADGAIVR